MNEEIHKMYEAVNIYGASESDFISWLGWHFVSRDVVQNMKREVGSLGIEDAGLDKYKEGYNQAVEDTLALFSK